ncbi:hypothetical protein EOK75_16710 (plasmid) [Pseudorhodobacter turbinis]|uniref:Uncharacterized protein n=1 Tax=Pseudorhodobacter turbinis TaxID=2500533 RepID=A0A4V1E196_9RHOB|nr:hypothetical protein [Pseudorhodobacter turbinis]QCO57364.1 hypothetical protein EOK75_16710 [Pseudorhodobacter turbinis]
MPFIYRPDGDTDYANAVILEDGARPQDVTGLAAGLYQVGNIGWMPDPVAVSAVLTSGPYATKSASDSYISGPVLASGTEAITIVLDCDLDAATSGSITLMEYRSTTLKVVYDSRSAFRRLSISAGTQSSPEFSSLYTPTDSMSDGRKRLVISFSANDGSSAALKVWIDGAEIISETATADNPALPTIRDFEALRSASLRGEFYELSIYGGTHAQGFAGDGGDVTGLTQLHHLSGDAANWNAPGTGLSKAGSDLFT